MAETLPPYTPDATCPKCGHNDVGTSYRERSWPDEKSWPQLIHTPHLKRVCRRCHYEWYETPLDAEVPQ